MTPDQRATRILTAQKSVIHGDQARSGGLTQRQLNLRVSGGRWRRVTRDVFVLDGSPDSWEQRATIASLATKDADGLLSFVTAGATIGVMRPSPLPHVTVPPGRSRRTGVARIHQAVVPAQDRARWNGLSTTSPSRLLVDMAGVLTRPALEELVDRVLCKGLASVDSVVASLNRAETRRGRQLLAEVLDVWTSTIKPDSVAEVRLLRLLAELGMTGVITQHEVFDHHGVFIGRLDVAVPRLRVGLEYDSVDFHNPRRWERDEHRYGRLRLNGWDVQGVTKVDLLPGQTRLANLVTHWISNVA